jgi:AcrR family transcriptional regulator
MGQRKTEQKKLKRQVVLESVARRIAQSRNGSFTISEIAADIGSSKRAIYTHFRSKADMLYQLDRYISDLRYPEVYLVLEDNSLSPRQKIEKVIRTHVHLAASHWQLSRVLYSDSTLKEAPPGVVRRITARRNRYRRAIRELIEQMVEQEGIMNISPEQAAYFMLGLITSLFSWYKKSSLLSPEELADKVVFSVFNGILPAPGQTENRRSRSNLTNFVKQKTMRTIG